MVFLYCVALINIIQEIHFTKSLRRYARDYISDSDLLGSSKSVKWAKSVNVGILS